MGHRRALATKCEMESLLDNAEVGRTMDGSALTIDIAKEDGRRYAFTLHVNHVRLFGVVAPECSDHIPYLAPATRANQPY